ncbi:MAG: hypothetical protein AAF361_14505 [Bacteroidota bacterium]
MATKKDATDRAQIRRWRFGLAYDVTQTDDGGIVFPAIQSRYARRYPADTPHLMIFADYAPFPAYPWVLVGGQARFLNFRDEGPLQVDGFTSPFGHELFEITNLYLYSGFKIELGLSRRIQLLLGAGLSTGVPLHFKREVVFNDPQQTAPGQPVFQSLDTPQAMKLGSYTQLGLQAMIHENIGLGFSLRRESLQQKNEYATLPNIVYTDRFPESKQLLASSVLHLQLHLAYSW